MSGPKVVRIVTVEEVTATCRGLLARLDQAVHLWQQKLSQLGEQDEPFYNGVMEYREKFEQMLKEQQFLEIQKLVPIEIDNLAEDIEHRKQERIVQRAKQRIENKQAQENSKAILKLLQEKNIDIPASLHKNLQQAIEGHYQENISQLLNQAFTLLTPSTTKQLTEQQQALLTRMTIDTSKQSFHDWLKQQNIRLQQNPYITRIESYLTELEFEQPAIYEVFAERLQKIEQEAQESRQKLLLDSLVLDLGMAVKEAKERNALQVKLELLMAELQQQTTEALSIDLKTLNTASIQQIEILIANCEQQLADITQATVAAYRQQAILQGLTSLGYEVRQGMQTQWAKDGKLVVRNPATPGYGIELAGKTENPRLQVRAVRLTAEHNKQRDTDVETLWCGDFSKLQAWLAKQGSELLLEKSLPIGQVALKQVLDEVIDATDSIKVEASLTK